jgi:DNA-directed RNA polymerase II subunit RPB2
MDLLESYFSKYTLGKLQIDSFNYFISILLPEIITANKMKIKIKKDKILLVDFQNVYIEPPYIYDDNRAKVTVYPKEAKLRDLNYETSVNCDILVDILEEETNVILHSQVYHKQELFKLPVMLRSSVCSLNMELTPSECENDVGGYFIIKGKERVLISQERINYNQIYVYKQKNKYLYMAEIRSIKEDGDYSLLIQAKLSDTDGIYFALPYFSSDIPLGVILLAMNQPLDELEGEIDHPLFRQSLYPYKQKTYDYAISYMSNYIQYKNEDDEKNPDFIYNILTNIGILIPHQEQTNCSTWTYLLLMCKKLLDTYDQKRPEDDRDHICNKRVEMPGDLLANLIKALFRKALKSTRLYMEKRDDYNIISVLNRFNITKRIYHCFGTGNWGVVKSNYIRQGVSQVLNRLSYTGTISHLRRLVVPIGKESRNTQVRQIHSSSFGFICCVETPEGAGSGIIKNFSILTIISEYTPYEILLELLDNLFQFKPCTLNPNYYKVLFNGVWHRNLPTEELDNFVDEFKKLRSINVIDKSNSISVDDIDQEILIQTDTGRIMRPVIDTTKLNQLQYYRKLYVNDNRLWDVLEENNIIIYIDGAEAEHSYISMDINNPDLQSDYCEIHPCVMFGITAGLTPFPDHSQAPRNIYHAAMSKQGIGMFALNYNNRFDTFAHLLHYPQKRIVNTHLARITHHEEMASGINCVVAIMTYTGFNQEDSVIINKSAIDRGLFHTTSYKTISCNEMKKGTHSLVQIQVPPQELQQKCYDYSLLDEDGIVAIGSRINDRSVLVGKVYMENDKYIRDCSLICKASEAGVVDKVVVTYNASGYKHVKIKVRILKIPEIGDKFASYEAQKGTCGQVYPQEDMPFDRNGISPDIILNPHAIPSRMTINMLLELLTGKACCFTGQLKDATAFEYDGEDIVESMGDVLKEHGFNSKGWETLNNGFTGEPFQAKIYMGVGYYQRLKHLVSEKCHARNRGDVQLLSRQPCAGRSRAGGLRFGEMERDCMIAHGVSSFLKERFFDLSDAYQMYVCPLCGHMDKKCNPCEQEGVKVNIPYACKLLFQELQGMGVKINIFPEK